MNFNSNKRSNELEMMDNPTISQETLVEALEDVSRVNKWLNGNRITFKAIERLIRAHPTRKHWRIADVGCGDGEMLRQMASYFKTSPVTFEFIGIDINARSIEMARLKSLGFSNMTYSAEDIFSYAQPDLFDVVCCTLTLHHLKDTEIPPFVNHLCFMANEAVLINDLERSKWAYRLFKGICPIFIKSEIAKNDGLISIASAFKRKELIDFSERLKLSHYSIEWKWAFRYLWIIHTA